MIDQCPDQFVKQVPGLVEKGLNLIKKWDDDKDYMFMDEFEQIKFSDIDSNIDKDNTDMDTLQINDY